MSRLVAWRRTGTPEGLSLGRLATAERGAAVDGWEIVIGEAETWALHFVVETDPDWSTRSAVLELTAGSGRRGLRLKATRRRRWTVDGEHRSDLDGCLDVDVAATPFTNTLPIRRLGLQPGQHAEIRVAWVDVPSLNVHAAGQRYTRLETAGSVDRYEFRQLPSGRRYLLSVDGDGIVTEYEGIWRQVQP